MIICPRVKYPIQPHTLKEPYKISDLWEKYKETPDSRLAYLNTFFCDSHHGGAHIAQPCYILSKYAQYLRGWKPFRLIEEEKWLQKNPIFGKNDPDMFCGQSIWPREKPIYLLERVDNQYYFRHQFACELARAYWEMGELKEKRPPYFPIRPHHIDTTKRFYGDSGTPFCNPEIARVSRLLIQVFQKMDMLDKKGRGGKWGEFSLKRVSEVSDRFFGNRNIYLENLISINFVVKKGEEQYCVTGKFILRCFQDSPEQYFFFKEESDSENNIILRPPITPF